MAGLRPRGLKYRRARGLARLSILWNGAFSASGMGAVCILSGMDLIQMDVLGLEVIWSRGVLRVKDVLGREESSGCSTISRGSSGSGTKMVSGGLKGVGLTSSRGVFTAWDGSGRRGS